MTIPRNLSFLAEGASSTGVLSVSNGGTGLTSLTANYIPYGNGTSAFSSSSNLYFSGSNLGIGTTSPASQLDSSSSSSSAVTWNIRTSNTNNSGVTGYGSGLQLALSTTSDNQYKWAGISSVAYTNYGNAVALAFYTQGDTSGGGGGPGINPTEKMRLFPSGGLSLGNTTDPGATNLSVTGSVSSSTLTTSSTATFGGGTNYGFLQVSNNQSDGAQTVANSGLMFAHTGTGTWAQAGIWPLGSSGFAGSLIFGTNNSGQVGTLTERMRIFASGGISIGNTTDPGATNLSVTGTIASTTTVKTGGYTVATLPTGITGARAYVTNALSPTFGSTVTGGGTVTVPVFYNGSNWIVG